LAEASFNQKYFGLIARAGIARFLLSPFTSLIFNPLHLARSIWNCRVLLDGRWRAYVSFSWTSSFLKLFYLTQADNLQRYGLRGRSPTMGGGLNLSWFWYQSAVGVTIFAALGGVVTVLLGMGVWLASHVIWLESPGVSMPMVALTIMAAAASNNFYGNLFDRQNYNVLGWMLLPAGLWAILNGHIWIAVLIWTMASLFSITVFLAAVMLTFTVCALTWRPYLLLSLAPGAVKFLIDLMSAHSRDGGGIRQTLANLLGMLGAGTSRKYKRPSRWLSTVAFCAVLGLFPAAVLFLEVHYAKFGSHDLFVISIVPVLWFFVNQARIFRIADAHSILLCYLSVTAAVTMISGSYWLLAAFWIANSNAFIAVILYQFDVPFRQMITKGPVVKPLDITPFVQVMTDFMSLVPERARLLLVCTEPGDDYNKLFVEYFPLSELLYHCANNRTIAVIPDFYSIGAGDATHLWGREPELVRKNMVANQTDFAVISGDGDSSVKHWNDEGFDVLAVLRWEEMRPILGQTRIFADEWPTWYLLFRTNESRLGVVCESDIVTKLMS
jgi:hypothetical protein